MTMIDVMALSAGVAVAIAVFSNWPISAFGQSRGGYLLLRVMRLLMGSVLALCCVDFARQVTYRRRARPAEWLAILVCGWSVAYLGNPGLAHLNQLEPSYSDLGQDFMRFLLEGVIFPLGVTFLGVGFLWVGRRYLPPSISTVILGGMGFIAWIGPFLVIGQTLPNLLAPRDGFGPGFWPILHHQACDLIAVIPQGLLFGVPAVACLIERIQQKEWVWAEWASLSASVLVGFVSSLNYRGEISQFSGLWLAERSLLLIWFVGVGLLSRWVVVGFAPGFWRWIEPVPAQEASSPLASEASTR